MKRNDKKQEKPAQEERKAPQTLDLDDLDQVQGGSIANVSYTSTADISSGTQSKI